MTTTTIQISKDLLQDLKSRKMYDKESYEDVIRDLLEDTMELSEQTLENMKQILKQAEFILLTKLKRDWTYELRDNLFRLCRETIE